MSDTLHDPVAITSTALVIDLLTLSYRIQTRYLHRLPHVSLPPLQLLLLFIADSRSDKTIRPSKVAHALGLSMSTVSEAIRKLRHKRFLMRTDTVAGLDSLPAEPGDWLSSPLALGSGELVGSTATEPGTRASLSESVAETPLLSLRRIAPPGFLTQSFAVESSAGCTS